MQRAERVLLARNLIRRLLGGVGGGSQQITVVLDLDIYAELVFLAEEFNKSPADMAKQLLGQALANPPTPGPPGPP